MILSHNGKAHIALRYLADNGSATPWEIWDAHWKPHQLSRRRKLAFLMGMLRDRGLITQADRRGPYEISAEGLAALAHLDGGSDLNLAEAVPNARVFVRAA